MHLALSMIYGTAQKVDWWGNFCPAEGIKKQYFVLAWVHEYRKIPNSTPGEYASKIQDSLKTFSVKLDLKFAGAVI